MMTAVAAVAVAAVVCCVGIWLAVDAWRATGRVTVP